MRSKLYQLALRANIMFIVVGAPISVYWQIRLFSMSTESVGNGVALTFLFVQLFTALGIVALAEPRQ